MERLRRRSLYGLANAMIPCVLELSEIAPRKRDILQLVHVSEDAVVSVDFEVFVNEPEHLSSSQRSLVGDSLCQLQSIDLLSQRVVVARYALVECQQKLAIQRSEGSRVDKILE